MLIACTLLCTCKQSRDKHGTRPQLSSTQADRFTVLKYLEKTGKLDAGLTRDPWDPTSGAGDVHRFTATFSVAKSRGTHATVQAAIDAAVTQGGSQRIYIELAPGTYREVVCVPANGPPITLYSRSGDAKKTSIVFDNYAGKAKPSGQSANPCHPNRSSTTYGTRGSATFAAYSNDFHAKNLSFANDTDEATASGGVQAVALMVQGDRAQFDNVRVLGNQDTLFVKTPDVNTVRRAYFKDCYVEGDVDFIFGRGTFVLDHCAIHTLTARNPRGVVVAPSTDSRNPYGILVVNSTLSAEAGTKDNSIHLGRAWDESQVEVATYAAHVTSGVFPNGQATFRNSMLGAHIRMADPWRAAATTARPYSSVHTNSEGMAFPANRLYEYRNTGPGSAP